MDGAGIIVSLACAAYETCQCAKQNKKDGIRIGDRLLNLVACAREWTAKSGDSSKKEETMRYLEDSLTKLNLVLQAHTLPQQQWTSKVKQFAKSRSIQDEITRCENQLDSALQDFQLRQHTALYIQNQDMFHELRDRMNQQFLQIFVLLGKQKLPSTTSQGLSDITYQEKKNEVLQGYQQEKAEHGTGAAITVPPLAYSSGGSTSTSSTGYEVSMAQFGNIGAKGTEPSADIQEELKQLVLDFSKLTCTFDREAFLGKGSFSKVYKGTYGGDGGEDNEVAIKRFRVTNIDVGQMTQSEKERHTRRFQSEAAMMSRCGLHQHIVQVVACHIDLNSNQLPLIVMERMESTLFDALHEDKIPSLKQRLNLLRGILGALEFLHTRGIVHQDVKSPNILLNMDSTVAKLSDFGEAKEKGFNTTQGMTNNMRTGGAATVGGVAIASGTPCYQPPEVLVEKVTEASRNADIHAFGVVLWECLTGDIPHRNKRLLQILLLAQDESRSSLLDIPTRPNSTLDETDKKVWESLRSLTESCLQRDRKQRPTASKLIQGWQFVDLEDSELKDDDDAEYELIHTLQTQLDSGDYGITNVPERDIRRGPLVVLPPTAPSRDHKRILGGRDSTSPGDRPLKKKLPAGVSSHVGAVRLGKVDDANDVQETENIEVNLTEAEAIAPVAAEEVVAVEQGQNNAAGNDTTDDDGTAKKYRKVVIFVVTFFAMAAVVIGVLVVSKFRSNDDVATPTPLPSSPVISASSPAPTRPSTIPRGTRVANVLADYGPFDEQALVWLADTDTWEPDEGDPNHDYLWLERYVIAELYFSTNGPSWSKNSNWLSSQPICNWSFALDTNECPGPITSLRLSFNNLTGGIPSSIGSLSKLVVLYLPFNALTGSIPSSIGNLSQLTSLYLVNNQLTGSIPSSIGNLSQLTTLYLSGNRLTGSVPSSISNLSQLRGLYFGGNQLTGAIPPSVGTN